MVNESTGRLEAHQQRKVAIGSIGFVDDFEVEGFGNNHAPVVFASVQCVVEDGGGEGTEDVASTEMHPCRGVMGLLGDGLQVELGQLIAFGCPFFGVVIAGEDVC